MYGITEWPMRYLRTGVRPLHHALRKRSERSNLGTAGATATALEVDNVAAGCHDLIANRVSTFDRLDALVDPGGRNWARIAENVNSVCGDDDARVPDNLALAIGRCVRHGSGSQVDSNNNGFSHGHIERYTVQPSSSRASFFPTRHLSNGSRC